MKYRKAIAMALLLTFAFVGCSKTVTEESIKVRHKEIKETEESKEPKFSEPTETDPEPTEVDPTVDPYDTDYDDQILDLLMWIGYPGNEIEADNTIREIIAEKTGVRVEQEYITGQTLDEAVGVMLASGQFPDFIDAGAYSEDLYENDVLISWDSYIDMYPNIRELYTDEEWDQFRMDDGHVYWANVFENHYKDIDTTTGHNEEAFWIQNRVLKEFGYPKIETLDDYFTILENYYELYPTMPDGTDIIPYTIMCEDWRYFCIENPPMYLDGYPNDGCCIVDVSNPADPVVKDYNTTDTAKKYFKKLNEAYSEGLIDPDFESMNYDDYISKLSTGCVLGMCDQYWDFNYSLMGTYTQDLIDLGCEYVPLGLTIEAGMKNQWHSFGDTNNYASGIAITTSCIDPDRAFEFLSRILDQDIHDLRFWGIEGVDYLVDENGMYYRTSEMRQLWRDYSYLAEHVCKYDYMPQWLGISRDGKNAMQPSEQTSEFYATLSQPMVDCFKAYGATTYAEMMGAEQTDHYPWYPLWTWSNNLSTNDDGGAAFQKMGQTKHKYLPMLVKSSDFESTWEEYMTAYEDCNPQDFIDAAQQEVDARLELARANGYQG